MTNEKQWADERHNCLVNYICNNPKMGKMLLDKWDKDPAKAEYSKRVRSEARELWQKK